jgi:hypothetical protein
MERTNKGVHEVIKRPQIFKQKKKKERDMFGLLKLGHFGNIRKFLV